MYIPRTTVRCLPDMDGNDSGMPVYSLELSNDDAATSSAVWREKMLAEKPPPFFDRLVKASIQAIELMTAEHSEQVDSPPSAIEVSGMFELVGEHQRLFLMGFSSESAVSLTKAVLREVHVEVDEDLISDCIGELCNIIIGRTRGEVGEQESFQMCTPIVVFSEHPRIHWQAQAEISEAHFSSRLGPYTIRLLTRLS